MALIFQALLSEGLKELLASLLQGLSPGFIQLQQQGKLFPAYSGQSLLRLERFLEQLTDMNKGDIAGIMAKVIVYLLEEIQIQQGKYQQPGCSLCSATWRMNARRLSNPVKVSVSA